MVVPVGKWLSVVDFDEAADGGNNIGREVLPSLVDLHNIVIVNVDICCAAESILDFIEKKQLGGILEVCLVTIASVSSP